MLCFQMYVVCVSTPISCTNCLSTSMLYYCTYVLQVLNKRGEEQVRDSNQLSSSTRCSNCCDDSYSSAKDGCHDFHRKMAQCSASGDTQQQLSSTDTSVRKTISILTCSSIIREAVITC